MRGVSQRFNPLTEQLVAVVAAGTVAALSWQLGYQPGARACRNDRAQAKTLTDRLAQTEAMVQAAGGQAAWIERQQQALARLRAAAPSQSRLPELLNRLVETMRGGGLQVVNVVQGTLVPLQQDGQPIQIAGTPYSQLPVTVTAEGRFHMLLTALERLTGRAFPGTVRIDQAELRLKEPTGMTLVATVQLLLPLAGVAPAASEVSVP